MRVQYALINAFVEASDVSANESGNPAAVVLLPTPSVTSSTAGDVFAQFPPDATLQAIASALALPMTAFLLPIGRSTSKYAVRWFNPTEEAPLCGHATIALAHYLFNVRNIPTDRIELATRFHGMIAAEKKSSGAVGLDFPELRGLKVISEENEERRSLLENLGVEGMVEAVLISDRDWLVEMGPKVDLKNLKLDLAYLGRLHPRSLILTQVAAASSSSTIDAPHVYTRVIVTVPGFVNEDFATGSAHCCVIPYFFSHAPALARLQHAHGDDLGDTLRVQQLSSRGGRMVVTWKRHEKRVEIVSRGVLVKEDVVEVDG
ncbi:hypothetical protein BCR39DRAFT_562799 [Naematelia encephala]|uniref:Phenazine biosynthesis PhzC/PhzF protein n=1 Tax=Naematelia encephala TaxID=71784 RepID=A0A1Y2AEZ7_9TREE|nr:hypothetical protein BCR39DRAFT_562799 [Naematelia encephala]